MAREDVTFSLGLDTKRIDSALASLQTSFVAVGAAFTAAFTGGAILTLKAAADAASVQEDAINALNTSLKLAGTFSEEASQEFQDFASALQDVTTVGDETTLQLSALARNFTDSNEQAKELVSAALDLSAATGISLESAVTNLGKSLSGLSGELGESVKGIRDLSQEALQSGGAIRLVSERFDGAAESLRQTFSGAVKAARDSFGDFLEEIGFAITRNPALIKLINELSKGLKGLSKFVKDNREALARFITEGVEDLLDKLIEFSRFLPGFTKVFSKAFIATPKAAIILYKGLENAFNGLVIAGAAVAKAFLAIPVILSKLGRQLKKIPLGISAVTDALRLQGEVLQSDALEIQFLKLQDAQLGARKSIVENAIIIDNALKDTAKGFQAIDDTDLSFLDKFTDGIVAAKDEVVKLRNEVKKIGKQETEVTVKRSIEDDDDGFGLIGRIIESAFNAIENGIKSIGAKVGEPLAIAAQQLVQTLVSGTEALSSNLEQQRKLERDLINSEGEQRREIQNEIAELRRQERIIQRDSAQNFITQLGGAITDVFLPGAGQFVTALLQLAQDPEAFQTFIEGFARALPDVIQVLVDSIPLVVDTLIENLPQIITALIDGIPRLIEALVDALPELIAVLIDNAPRIAVALIEALVELAPQISVAIIEGIAEGIKRLFENLQQDLTGEGFQVGGTLGQISEGVKDAFGFQGGGVVPPGFPNDSFPARLTSGEVVLNEEQQAALAEPKMITVQLVLNDDVLASTILELNRDNKRLA